MPGHGFPWSGWPARLFIAGSLAVTLVLARGAKPTDAMPAKNVAAIVTSYRHNSRAAVLVSRLFQTDTRDWKGKDSSLKLVLL